MGKNRQDRVCAQRREHKGGGAHPVSPASDSTAKAIPTRSSPDTSESPRAAGGSAPFQRPPMVRWPQGAPRMMQR